jgi:DNA-binding transcriptional MerR regulator
MVPEPTWTVRELADEFAITTRTLRFWEAEGLISPERAGTARIYHARDRARLRLILRGRRFGMTLAECASVIDIYDGAATSERRQLHTLIDRLGVLGRDLQARRDDLERTLTEVTQVTDQCRQRLAELET